jgi:DNA-binding NarL/FixJ family response regulator
MRAALRDLFRAHFVEIDVDDAVDVTSAVQRFDEAEDGWLIVHFPSKPSADLEIIQACAAFRVRRLVIFCGGTAVTEIRKRLETGASGIVSDNLSATEVVSAMRSIFAGHSIINVDEDRHDKMIEMEALADAIHRLNQCSRVIVNLLCEGRSTREIAAERGISVRTVRWHITKLLSQLNMNNRCRLVAHVTYMRALASTSKTRGQRRL